MEEQNQQNQPYQLTPRDAETVDAFRAKLKSKPPAPKLKIKVEDDKHEVSIDHKDQGTGWALFMATLNTTDYEFAIGIVRQLVSSHGKGEAETNYMLAMVRGIEPRDPLETMLAVQMAAIHNLTMKYTRQLAFVENIPQQDSAERALNKLARTFTTQIETLKRYRSTGEQKITVQHVTVNDGGQAVIGQVAAGEGRNKKEELPHVPKPLTHAESETLPCPLEAVREAVPSPGG
jgi:hypothetical protein